MERFFAWPGQGTGHQGARVLPRTRRRDEEAQGAQVTLCFPCVGTLARLRITWFGVYENPNGSEQLGLDMGVALVFLAGLSAPADSELVGQGGSKGKGQGQGQGQAEEGPIRLVSCTYIRMAFGFGRSPGND